MRSPFERRANVHEVLGCRWCKSDYHDIQQLLRHIEWAHPAEYLANVTRSERQASPDLGATEAGGEAE